jgi:hypothetical protein
MLDKARISAIGNDLRDALKAVAEKHNLNLTKSNISFATDFFNLSCTFGDKDELGDANPLYRVTMQRKGHEFGLSIEDIGKKFMTRQGEVEIIGMRGSHVIGKQENGRLYKYDPVTVAGLLGQKPTALRLAVGGRS